MMPVPPPQPLELRATAETTNILGIVCVRYNVEGRGEKVDIWATDRLLPFQPYRYAEPSRFGARRIEERWPALLTERRLFPLRVTLHRASGAPRPCFEVTAIRAEMIIDPDGRLFQPPADYREMQPLPR